MDNTEAVAILQAYAEGQTSQIEYEKALQYLQTVASDAGLARLYHDLTQPGDLACETAQPFMLDYFDPFARLQLSPQERKQLLQHVTQCPDCSQEFLELNNVSEPLPEEPRLIPTFKIPPLPQAWPTRWFVDIKKEVDSLKKLLVTLKLSPEPVLGNAQSGLVLNEDKAQYDTRQLTLVGTRIGKLGIETKVSAQRIDPSTCRLTVTLESEELMGKKVGQSVTCRFEQATLIQKTDQQGQVIFENIPIESLDKLQFDLDVQL